MIAGGDPYFLTIVCGRQRGRLQLKAETESERYSEMRRGMYVHSKEQVLPGIRSVGACVCAAVWAAVFGCLGSQFGEVPSTSM